jgi:hypothetical protein
VSTNEIDGAEVAGMNETGREIRHKSFRPIDHGLEGVRWNVVNAANNGSYEVLPGGLNV